MALRLGFIEIVPAKKKAAPAKTAKCPTCHKSTLKCSGHYADKGTPEKAKVKVEGRDGRSRTVTKNTGNTIRGENVWCGTCNCLVREGTCSNVTCSSRSGT